MEWTKEQRELPPLDVTNEDRDKARFREGFNALNMRDYARESMAARYCRERQLTAALSEIERLKGCINHLAGGAAQGLLAYGKYRAVGEQMGELAVPAHPEGLQATCPFCGSVRLIFCNADVEPGKRVFRCISCHKYVNESEALWTKAGMGEIAVGGAGNLAEAISIITSFVVYCAGSDGVPEHFIRAAKEWLTSNVPSFGNPAPPSGEQAARQRVGIRVPCAVCGREKKPRGRSAPMGLKMCDDECPGYSQEPRVGDLWPGETQEDFGYPVSADGTELAPVEVQSPKGEV